MSEKKRKVHFEEPAPKTEVGAPAQEGEVRPDEEDEGDFMLFPGQRKKRVRSADEKEQAFLKEQEAMMAEATKMLQEHFSEAQSERYVAFRRSALKDASVRRVMNGVTTLNMPKNTMVAIKGAAKLYVGELVEEARTIMDERGEVGAIRPWHVREAFNRLQAQGKAPILPSVMSKGFTARRNVL